MENSWTSPDPETRRRELRNSIILLPNLLNKQGWEDDGKDKSWQDLETPKTDRPGPVTKLVGSERADPP